MSILSAPSFHNEAAAHALVEGVVWPTGPVCPRCNGTARITPVKGGRIGLYRCGPCKRQFTVKVNSVFEDSHVPMHQWLQVVHMMVSSKKGVSSHQVMRTLEVQYKTAWFMTHRIRLAMSEGDWPGCGRLGGAGEILEADETFVGGKAENRAVRPDPAEAERLRSGRTRGEGPQLPRPERHGDQSGADPRAARPYGQPLRVGRSQYLRPAGALVSHSSDRQSLCQGIRPGRRLHQHR